MKKRIPALLLCLIMLFTLVVPAVYADEGATTEEPSKENSEVIEEGINGGDTEGVLTDEMITAGDEAVAHIGSVDADGMTLATAVSSATAGDTIYLTGDVTMTSTTTAALTIDKNLTITDDSNTDNKARTITLAVATADQTGIIDVTSGTLTLKGTAAGRLVLDGSYPDANNEGVTLKCGSPAISVNGGTLNTENVTIQNTNVSGYNGGGVYVASGTFEMNAGTKISSCTTSGNGGGVYVKPEATFTMNGGIINGCTANGDKGGGGVYVSSNATFTMNGGTISECTAIPTGANGGKGGGVYCNGTFNMKGGTISSCTASGNGGGIYNKGTLKIEGGTVSDGIYLYESTLTVTGGTVSGSIEEIDSKSVTISGGTFTTFNPTKYLAAGYYAESVDTTKGPWNVVVALGFRGTNNLNLSSDLKFGFYFNKYDSSVNLEDLSILFTMTDKNNNVITDTVSSSSFVTVVDSDKGENNNRCYYYAVFDGISPQFIGTTVTAKLYNGTTEVGTFSNSILGYAEALYKKDAAKYGTVISDLVDYGIAANAYAAEKGYAQGTVYTRDNCSWLKTDQSAGTPSTAYSINNTDGLAGYSFTAANVNFNVSNSLYIYFTISEMPYGKTVNDCLAVYKGSTVSDAAKLDTAKYTISNQDDEYICKLSDIKASEFNNTFTFALTDGTKVKTLTYGIEAYAKAWNASTDETKTPIKNLAVATYRFGISAANLTA